jgi:hypothetical protein
MSILRLACNSEAGRHASVCDKNIGLKPGSLRMHKHSNCEGHDDGEVTLSSPHHYIAIKGANRFFACLRVRAIQATPIWGFESDVKLSFDEPLSSDAEQWADLREQDRPHLRAMYSPSRRLIHVEALDKGCLLKGQRFISSTLNQIRALVPFATTVVLANVMHSQTRHLLLELLQAQDIRPLDAEPSPGPLIKGLLRAGCFNITAARENRASAYINLTAMCKGGSETSAWQCEQRARLADAQPNK